MKKLMYSLFATALVVLSGCQDDVVEQKPSTPAQVGDEISFGSSLRDVQTRTIYDDEPTQAEDGSYYYRVRWEEGDQIAIYCPQASNGTLVNYSVSPDANDPTRSSRVTKVNTDKPGLQWGESDVHRFYGFYPANRVTGTENGLINGHVPTEQRPEGWNEVTNNNGGTNFYGKTNTDNAYMWAYGEFTKSTMGNQDVPLTFHPWMTVLQIKIPGPKSGTMKISNVNIIAKEGTQTAIAGDFVCDMTPVEENGATGVPVYRSTTEGQVTNTISISGWNSDVQDFVELDSPNDTMIVRAYLLPIDDSPTARNLQIAVQTMNGAPLTRTLGYSNADKNSIQPHKVNTVILPNLTATNRTNYWMSSLDRNIYLSELSIPGSKFSYLTSANAGDNAAFQGVDIEHQFVDGVRGFIVQVGANATYNATQTGGGIFNPQYSYTYTDATLPIFCGSGKKLSDAISSIANALSTAEKELGQDRNLECAVVMITYAGNDAVSADFTGSGRHNIRDVGGAEHVWMDAIANELKQLGKDAANRIYTGEITANTTLDDVKGKIILKVNTNSDAQNGYIVADDVVPALFSRWNGAINTVDLRWGSPNTNSTRTPLKWMYQEATHVGTGTEITPEAKYDGAMNVFQNSIKAYTENTAHDTWFMNDCGGTFHGVVSGTNVYDKDYGNGDTNDEAPINFAHWFNPQITRYLQERDANASLGLVFFNFADKQQDSGRKYGTDNLIQSIIDNNFKFNLRKEGSSTDTNNSSLSNSGSGYGNGGALIK